jgi:hypothetical protein
MLVEGAEAKFQSHVHLKVNPAPPK